MSTNAPRNRIRLNRLAPQPVRRIIRPTAEFLRTEAGGGIVLLLAAVTAVVWANSPWDDTYFELLERHFGVDLGWVVLDEPLHAWINDGLMAIFFFVVGLEIKREVLRGELASLRRAALPAAGALGGMVVPALVFLAFNLGGDGERGWGIPMATDIAFAVGVMALLGNRIPFSLKIFLLALAIVDDLGAIIVIAIFYTESLSVDWLIAAIIVVGVILGMERTGIRNVDLYIVAGVVLWLCVFESGIHATLAGVVLGFLTPATAYVRADDYTREMNGLIAQQQAAAASHDHEATGVVLHQIELLTRDAEAPLDRLEHMAHPWSSYVIIPLFALANAGLVLSGDTIGDAVSSAVTQGIFAGLVFGKLFGILLASFIAVRLGLGELPAGSNWMQVAGAATLAGIGFTVSLFITELAFSDPVVIDDARIGIFAASIFAGIVGYLMLRMAKPAQRPGEQEAEQQVLPAH